MNEKFFSLPLEKQQTILNAGFHVFSRNPYKKSPMREIADAAGISKALLFHYFQNKKELYLYLWETCARLTTEEIEKNRCYEEDDLFDALRKGMEAKLRLMRQYPDLGFFSLRAYYEKDPEVCKEIQESVRKHSSFDLNANKLRLDPEKFVPGLDLEMMYWNMYWVSEGYLWEKSHQGSLDVDEAGRDFERLIRHWESVYLRKNTEVTEE